MDLRAWRLTDEIQPTPEESHKPIPSACCWLSMVAMAGLGGRTDSSPRRFQPLRTNSTRVGSIKLQAQRDLGHCSVLGRWPGLRKGYRWKIHPPDPGLDQEGRACTNHGPHTVRRGNWGWWGITSASNTAINSPWQWGSTSLRLPALACWRPRRRRCDPSARRTTSQSAGDPSGSASLPKPAAANSSPTPWGHWASGRRVSQQQVSTTSSVGNSCTTGPLSPQDAPSRALL